MARYYLVLDREIFWSVEPLAEYNLIDIVQELYPKPSSEHDAATRTPPGSRCFQKVLLVATKLASTEKLNGPGVVDPAVPEVMESIHRHKIQCQVLTPRAPHVCE